MLALAVFSHHGHFNLSQFALRRASLHLKNLSKIYVVWDDLTLGVDHDRACFQFQQLGYTVLRHSQWNMTINESQGWIRQQWVKLHLHQQLDEDQWIVLDGDTVLNRSYTLSRHWCWVSQEHYLPYWQFIEHALGLTKTVNHSWICPLQIFERSVLAPLESLNLPEKFNQWRCLRSDPIPGLSEFEIYGTWAHQQLKISRETRPSPFRETADARLFQQLACHSDQDVVWHGSDHVLIDVANWH